MLDNDNENKKNKPCHICQMLKGAFLFSSGAVLGIIFGIFMCSS